MLFVKSFISQIIAAGILLPFAVLTCLAIKKRRSLSINKKEVLLLVTVLAVLYVVFTEMTGLYFQFYKNPYFVTQEILFKFAIPIATIIVTTEIIRAVLLVTESTKAISGD